MTKPSNLWQEEFYDIDLVLQIGVPKYGANTWLHEDVYNAHFDHRQNHASINRHTAFACANPYSKDKESGLNHHLHAACRHLMEYTRIKRGLKI